MAIDHGPTIGRPGRDGGKASATESFPPIQRFRVTLRMTRPARFRFFHGGVLMGLVSTALGDHPPEGLIPVVCEMGRVRFDPGDTYRFGLTVVGQASPGLDRVIDGVSRIGRARPDPSKPLPTLGGNFAVEAVEDLPPPDVDGEVDTLRGIQEMHLQLVSPVRLKRPKAQRRSGGEFLDGDCFPFDHFLDLLWRRLFKLATGRWPRREEREAGRPSFGPDLSADASRLLWLDVPIKGVPGTDPARPGGKTPGGVVGRLTVRGVPEPWLPALVLGQHTHVGAAVHYGLGRYRIREASPLPDDPYAPGETVLERMCRHDTMAAAAEHVVANTTTAGVDGISPERFSDDRAREVGRLTGELRRGTYRPKSLLGLVAEDRPGKLRPLAVPTIRDRVAQRAAVSLLDPAVDTLLEDCSYAYRKGFSRSAAAFAIQDAYDDGYRYVLDADITSFFDAVPWDRMLAKLDALLPYEPLVPLLEAWIRAPVVLDGATVERERGLPQGAVISPLLANLYLDELDEHFLGRGFRLVRYADDFVVLCRDLQEAERAREQARSELDRLGLTLNPDKTRLASFDEGFSYLGYLFCGSLVMSKARRRSVDGELSAESVPRLSWLAQIPFERVRELVRRGPPAGPPERRVEMVPLGSEAAADIEGYPLYVTLPQTRLHLARETLVVEHPDEDSRAFPIRGLRHVTFFGRSRATLPLVLRLARHGVPSYFCRPTGELEGCLLPPETDWQLWMAQARAAENDELRLQFARAVVAAKLHNAARLVVRFRLGDADEVSARLRDLEASCLDQTRVEALRGLEGSGAAAFFGALSDRLAPEWRFHGRRKNPPPDPVNAMLSYGYTILYHHLTTALVSVGLNPRIGLYHESRGTFHALAADLQEELRYLVDAIVLAKVNRREVKPDQFRPGDARRPWLLGHDLRRRFIEWFEVRMLTEHTPPGEDQPLSYRAMMERQAARVRAVIAGRGDVYQPHRAR